jgi:hypothetical protein
VIDSTTTYTTNDADRPRNSWRLAVVALLLALIGLVTCGAGSIAALIVGYIARRRARVSHHVGEHRLAVAAVVVGWSGLVLYVVATALIIALLVWDAHHPHSTSHHHFHFHD